MSVHGFDDSMLQTPRAKHLWIECLIIRGEEKYNHEKEKFETHKNISKFIYNNPQEGVNFPWAIIKVDNELSLVDLRCDLHTFIYKGLTYIEEDYEFLGFDDKYPLFKKPNKQEEK